MRTSREATLKAFDLCTRQITAVSATTPLAAVAQQMRLNHVGSVVVTADGGRKPIGIVTDRDIVVEVVAMGLDPATLRASDVMSTKLVVARAGDDALWSLKVMREHGVRRLPVVDGEGDMVGLLAFDDVMQHVATTLGDMAQMIGTERDLEVRRRA